MALCVAPLAGVAAEQAHLGTGSARNATEGCERQRAGTGLNQSPKCYSTQWKEDERRISASLKQLATWYIGLGGRR